MKVLVACEFSGIVRDAFIAEGHDAISCDLLPTERPGPHVQGDVTRLLWEHWDLVIAFPPCNYLSYLNEWFRNHERYDSYWDRFEQAVAFFNACRNAMSYRVAVENPRPASWAIERIGRPDQITDAAHFGERYRKRTYWWLKNLPPLMATQVNPHARQFVNIPKGKGGLADVKSAGLGPAKTSHDRSRFWPGMAAAMAKQWGNYQ